MISFPLPNSTIAAAAAAPLSRLISQSFIGQGEGERERERRARQSGQPARLTAAAAVGAAWSVGPSEAPIKRAVKNNGHPTEAERPADGRRT